MTENVHVPLLAAARLASLAAKDHALDGETRDILSEIERLIDLALSEMEKRQ